MGTETVVGFVLALLLGAGTFAYGGFELTSAHPFLAALSYVIAIGCVAGALVVGIIAPTRSAAKREKDDREERIRELEQGNERLRSQRASSPSASVPSSVPAIVKSSPVQGTITPQYLVGLFKGRTELQAQKLVKEHVGTEMTVSGKVRAVEAFIGSRARIRIESDPPISAYFDSDWLERLSALHVGDQISVTGEVDLVSENSLALEKCKIVSVAT